MDESNLAALHRMCPPLHRGKLHLLLEFAPELGLQDVPDPYYGNLAGFERVLTLCEAGVHGLIKSQTQAV
jgi:protein-tyrosine phosphatase